MKTFKPAVTAAFSVIPLAILTGCTSMVSGTIVDKSYTPTYPLATCRGTGSSTSPRICTTTWIPASWKIQVEGTNSEGDPDTGWVSVSSGEYPGIEIGSSYEEE